MSGAVVSFRYEGIRTPRIAPVVVAVPFVSREVVALRRKAAVVRGYIRRRREREKLFSADLFADPAWDMLLDLYASELEQCRVSVSSLCIASCVPPTTALRWIAKLASDGLIVREGDPTDGRRHFVALTPGASAAMGAFFAGEDAGSVAAAGPRRSIDRTQVCLTLAAMEAHAAAFAGAVASMRSLVVSRDDEEEHA